MSKQEIVTITSYASAPFGDRPCSTSQEINSWLNSTDPAYVRGAGQTYTFASSKVEQAISSLEEHAGRIAQIWKGPDASKARQALQLLHASGQELSTKMQQMGTALQSYAGHLETAREEAKRAPTDAEIDGNHLQGTGAEKPDIEQAAKNMIAQDAIHKLNTEIVTIFDSEVPDYIMYELPTVSLPGTGGGYENPGYPTGSGTRGAHLRLDGVRQLRRLGRSPGRDEPGRHQPGRHQPRRDEPRRLRPRRHQPGRLHPRRDGPERPRQPEQPGPRLP
ncbi:WXG100 family type VII secretion target [Nonomuraea ferruginea]